MADSQQERPGALRRFLRGFATGGTGEEPISRGLAEGAGHPEMEGLSRKELEILLGMPKIEAETQSAESLAEERRARAKSRPLSDLAKEDIGMMKLAVDAAAKNDPLWFNRPMEEKKLLINDAYSILRAAKSGKSGIPLPSEKNKLQPKVGTIRVKLKSTGQTGTIPEKEFNQKLYEKL